MNLNNERFEKWREVGMFDGLDDPIDQHQISEQADALLSFLMNNKEYGDSFESILFLILRKLYKRDNPIDPKKLCDEVKEFANSDMVKDFINAHYPFIMGLEFELIDLFIEKRSK